MTISGCGDTPKLGRVAGKVKLDGKLVPNTTVIFAPTNGPSSYGVTDENGHYELMFSDRAGAVLGQHRVTLETYSVRVDDEGNKVETDELFPAKYNAESELTREVEPGKQTFDFDVTSE